jgi:hypothetical protein
VKHSSRAPIDRPGSTAGGLPTGDDSGGPSRRALVGIITLVLLAIAGTLSLIPGDEAYAWMGACLRVALVMGPLWLAWPQLARLHPWLILGGLAAMVAVLLLAKQPRVLLMGLVILFVLARLRPRS